MLIRIENYSDRRLDLYARDTEKELAHYYEPHGGVFVAESPKVIRRALDAGFEPLSFLVEERLIRNLLSGQKPGDAAGAARESGEMERIVSSFPEIPVYTAPLDVLMKITGYRLTEGAMCAMRRREMLPPEVLCRPIRSDEKYWKKPIYGEGRQKTRIAVLCNIENQTNVGAVFRAAAALGMDAVLVTKDSADPLYRRAIRVSMGTVFQMPWTYVERTGLTDLLHGMGYRTAALALREVSVSIADPRLKAEDRLAVLVGNEGDGLPADVIDSCDYCVKIPMSHGVDSLNAASAAAVAFWELGGGLREEQQSRDEIHGTKYMGRNTWDEIHGTG